MCEDPWTQTYQHSFSSHSFLIVGGPPVQAQVPALPEDNLPESFGLKWQGSCEIWAPLNMGQKLNTKSDLASILKCGLVCPSHPDLDMSSIPLCHSNIQVSAEAWSLPMPGTRAASFTPCPLPVHGLWCGQAFGLQCWSHPLDTCLWDHMACWLARMRSYWVWSRAYSRPWHLCLTGWARCIYLWYREGARSGVKGNLSISCFSLTLKPEFGWGGPPPRVQDKHLGAQNLAYLECKLIPLEAAARWECVCLRMP